MDFIFIIPCGILVYYVFSADEVNTYSLKELFKSIKQMSRAQFLHSSIAKLLLQCDLVSVECLKKNQLLCNCLFKFSLVQLPIP